jgi:hypothetical protein
MTRLEYGDRELEAYGLDVVNSDEVGDRFDGRLCHPAHRHHSSCDHDSVHLNPRSRHPLLICCTWVSSASSLVECFADHR